MISAPRAFRHLFAAHNRNVLLLATLSLLGAAALWSLVATFVLLITLGLLTSIQGESASGFPPWLWPGALGVVIVLFLWGSLDQWFRRYATPSDRAIIGWHIFPDTLLLPVRMTFAVWGNLSALVRYSRHDIEHAWWVLQKIQTTGRVPTNALGQFDSDVKQLERSIIALQILGVVDLHQGSEGPFFLVRSEAIDRLNQALLIEKR